MLINLKFKNNGPSQIQFIFNKCLASDWNQGILIIQLKIKLIKQQLLIFQVQSIIQQKIPINIMLPFFLYLMFGQSLDKYGSNSSKKYY
ncbi:unnamed protein product [Paramecium sonneborni]|uniref:Uncharacterized protein n=1 Tax=Paramecium sonneborni TaxID=65129 RepID=A0A8S1QRQ8_9CILI|nr:unnamed protein product [Paramecium sonneborni]